MPEPTLTTLFADADPARTAILEPVEPQAIAAAVSARIAADPPAPPRARPVRSIPRPLHFGLAGAAAAAVLAGGVVAWPHGGHQSSAWAVTPHADHTVTITVGAGPGTHAIADRLHTDLQAAGLTVPVYLTSRPGQCTTPLHEHITDNRAYPGYPTSSPTPPNQLTIDPDSTPPHSTLILVVDEGQPSLGGVFITGPLPACIPYSDSPADGGVTPIQDR